MSEIDDRVWLKHKETGHFFHCPALAVEDMADNGWEVTDDRPVEFNPTTAEMPSWMFEPIPGPKQVKPKRVSATTEEGDDVG